MILVTGGAGFIGSNLVKGLQDRGIYDLAVCDVLGSDEKWRNLQKRELSDFVMPDKLFEFLGTHANKIEVIFHMGAISATTERDADKIINENFILTRKLWDFCAMHDIRFIYASSAATYGDGSVGFKDDEFVEHLAKLHPLNAYGWSKHLFDRFVSRQGKVRPPQSTGLKFFNVYGPNEFHKGDMMSVICKLYPQIKRGEAAKLFKDGTQSRDFIYVRDCVDVMLWLLDNEKVNGLFNVGTGKARSFADLARATFSAAGIAPKIDYIDMPEILREKYQSFTEADMSKLKKVGYSKPFTGLEDGVADYVRIMSNTKDPYI